MSYICSLILKKNILKVLFLVSVYFVFNTFVNAIYEPTEKKPFIVVPPISSFYHAAPYSIKVIYNNGGDTLDNINLTILKIESKGFQASITNVTASDFMLKISPIYFDYRAIGLVSITISVSNIVGASSAILVFNAVNSPYISFDKYNYLITHSSDTKKIPITGLVGTIVSVRKMTPQPQSVITNLRANAFNIKFNTKGKAGTEHIIVDVVDRGLTKTVQLFIQVMQESVSHFSSALTITDFSEENSYTRSVVGDLDGDGHLDVFIAHSSKINWYKNNGSGVFTKQPPFEVDNTRDLAIGDLDGDGDLDLFIVGTSVKHYIYLNNGSGVFTQRSAMSYKYSAQGVSLGDIDNDGDLDAYVSSFQNQNQLRINDGSANFTYYEDVGSIRAYSSALGDVDNDGDLDIYVGSSGYDNEKTSNELLINNGNLNFSSILMNSSSGRGNHGKDLTEKVKFADFNNDNNLDLYILNNGYRLKNRIYIGDGAGNFTINKNITGDDLDYSSDVSISDVNKDSLLDIYIVRRGQNKLWLGTGDANFINNDIAGDLGKSTSSNIADFNNDGVLDFFCR